MALIMFSGVFGFGEMVSYISFMGDGGRGCWRGCLVTAGSATLRNFTFSIGSLNYACWLILLHTTIWNFTCLALFAFYVFYLWQYHKTLQCDGILRGLPIFALTCLLQNSYFPTSCARDRFGQCSCWLYCSIFESNGTLVSFSCTHKNSSNVCGVILLIMWLCCGAETPGGEVFVRSFVSHYPEGFQRSIFLLQQVPRLYQCYLFIAFPSLPTKRHRWHWLRCAKNLLMCLNYLCLMLWASVCSGALGRHYSCDGNSLRITALHPIWLHSLERCHRVWRPL